MKYFIYKTTNIINSKYYIGVHQTKNLDDGYLGSGKYLQNAIRKNGKDNFERIIFETFDSSDAMFLKEKSIITEEMINDPNCYNLAPGGTGGSMKQNRKSFKGPHSEETKAIISKKAKEWADTHDNPFKGKTHSKETRKIISENTSEAVKGKKKSLQHRQNLSNSTSAFANVQYMFIDNNGSEEIIIHLVKWCESKELDYHKVFAYIDKGPIKMFERYRSNTREWFIGCSISRVRSGVVVS